MAVKGVYVASYWNSDEYDSELHTIAINSDGDGNYELYNFDENGMKSTSSLDFSERLITAYAFEADYNRQNAAELETSKMNKRILERRQRALEDKAAKGKIEDGELEQLAQQIATYKERTPLRLYVDDVTTEKLTAVLADGGGKAAIVSAEGGIFDSCEA